MSYKFIGENPYLETIKNIPKELKHFNYWGYSQLPYKETIDNKVTTNKGKAPCSRKGFLRSYKDTHKFLSFMSVISNNPLKLYYSFALMNRYICVDIDGCFDDNGVMYSWAKDIIDTFDKKGFYIEYSLSMKGLHVLARLTDEIKVLIKKLFNGNKKQVQINKTHEEYKNLPDKCKLEIFTDFIIIITGKIYKNNNPENIKESGIFLKNMLYSIDKISKNTWHKKETSIDEVVRKDNNINDVFNYIKYFINMDKILSYYNINRTTNKNMSCPLPGHKDKTPSFSVNNTFNLWYCHACKVGGSVIDFVMAMENLSNPLDAAKKINEMFMLDIKFTKKLELLSKKDYLDKKVKEKIISKIDDDLEDVPWIYSKIDERTGEVKYKILCPTLAEYIRDKKEHIFVKDNNSTPLKYIYQNGVYILVDENLFASMIKKYIPLELQKSKDIREVIYLLVTDSGSFISPNELNPEKYINFKNGLLNIKTWEIEKHTPKVFSTIQIPYNYIPDLKCTNSVFDKYLSHLTNHNEEKEQLLRQVMAVTISNIAGYRMKKALFMVGPHDVGKTQVKKLLTHLIGDENSSSIDLKQMETRFGGYQVFTKRLVGSSDMSHLNIEELKFFKMLTGGDSVFIESKGKDGFNTTFNGVLWFCCNQLPLFKGDRGDGVYNRIIVFECNNPVTKKDRSLLDKMVLEAEYIISSIIKNLKQVIDNGYNYNIPKECEFKLEEYKTKNNSFLDFMQECCNYYSDANEEFEEIKRADFYRYYCLWNKESTTSKPETKTNVFKILKDKGLYETRKSNGHQVLKFISIDKDVILEYKGLLEKNFPSRY